MRKPGTRKAKHWTLRLRNLTAMMSTMADLGSKHEKDATAQHYWTGVLDAIECIDQYAHNAIAKRLGKPTKKEFPALIVRGMRNQDEAEKKEV